MIIKDLELEAFEILYQVPKGFFDNKHLLVDMEITNDLSPDWVYSNAKPCCVGFLLQNKVMIYLAENDNDTDFITAIQKYMKDNSEKVFALNQNFESTVLQSFFDIQYVDVHEIKPFKAKFWNKKKFFNELIKDEQIPQLKLQDPYTEDKLKTTEVWADYKKTQDKNYLDMIAGHVLISLLKESVILNNNQYYNENYNINKKGWLIGIGKKKVIIESKITKIYNHDSNAIIEVTIPTKEGDKTIQLKSYYKMADDKPMFNEGSNWEKYKRFYGKEPEVNDIVKTEPDSKGQAYYVLL